MKARATTATIALLLALPSPVHADPCRESVEVETGETVPCAGTLITRSQVDRSALCTTGLRTAVLDLYECRKNSAIDHTADAGILSACQTALDGCEASRLPEVVPWWQEPRVVLPTGIVGGVALVLGVLWAAGQAR